MIGIASESKKGLHMTCQKDGMDSAPFLVNGQIVYIVAVLLLLLSHRHAS